MKGKRNDAIDANWFGYSVWKRYSSGLKRHEFRWSLIISNYIVLSIYFWKLIAFFVVWSALSPTTWKVVPSGNCQLKTHLGFGGLARVWGKLKDRVLHASKSCRCGHLQDSIQFCLSFQQKSKMMECFSRFTGSGFHVLDKVWPYF